MSPARFSALGMREREIWTLDRCLGMLGTAWDCLGLLGVAGYSDVVLEDDKTRLFRSLVPRWRNICGRRDEEAWPNMVQWKKATCIRIR